MAMKTLTLLAFAAACAIRCEGFVVKAPLSVSSSCLSSSRSNNEDMMQGFSRFAAAAALSLAIFASPAPAFADGQTKDFKLPPIDNSDKNRCVLSSSKMGQANAARDKLYDLRECKLSGQDASGFDLSGVIMTKTDVSKAKFVEAYFSKAYLQGASR